MHGLQLGFVLIWFWSEFFPLSTAPQQGRPLQAHLLPSCIKRINRIIQDRVGWERPLRSPCPECSSLFPSLETVSYHNTSVVAPDQSSRPVPNTSRRRLPLRGGTDVTQGAFLRSSTCTQSPISLNTAAIRYYCIIHNILYVLQHLSGSITAETHLPYTNDTVLANKDYI